MRFQKEGMSFDKLRTNGKSAYSLTDDIGQGRAAALVPHLLLGVARITKRSSPPARSAASVTKFSTARSMPVSPRDQPALSQIHVASDRERPSTFFSKRLDPVNFVNFDRIIAGRAHRKSAHSLARPLVPLRL